MKRDLLIAVTWMAAAPATHTTDDGKTVTSRTPLSKAITGGLRASVRYY
jgi:hypothetical protein